MKSKVEKEVKITLELTEVEFLTIWAGHGRSCAEDRTKDLRHAGYEVESLGHQVYDQLNAIREEHLPA